MNSNTTCPCCGHNNFFEILKFPTTPVSGVLRAFAESPLPVNELAFEVCTVCGLLRNSNYASPPDYLEKPRPTARQLPAYQECLLDQIGGLLSKDELVLEIGSNDGSFLDLLREKGYSNVFGVEPSSELVKIAREKGHRIVAEYFEPDLVETLLATYGAPKMVICRHTLEHVPFPGSFIQALRDLLAPENGTALVEVPDSTAIPEGLNFVELWDEHLFYFTPYTLRLLMKRSGLRVSDAMVFPHLDTRNILVRVIPGADIANQAEVCSDSSEAELWKSFSERFQIVSEQIRDAVQAQPGLIYLIGASHPQCNFVNYLGLESFVDFMIDDDPVKTGKLPSISSNSVRIITSEEFSDQPQGGTLILTAFGYARWTRKISDIAVSKGIKILDPLVYT
jgi:SAM-dependent methyltransferase